MSTETEQTKCEYFSKKDLIEELEIRISSNNEEIDEIFKHNNVKSGEELLMKNLQTVNENYLEIEADNLFLKSLLKVLKPKPRVKKDAKKAE